MDSSRDLLDLEIKPEFLALAGGFFPLSHLGSLKSISKYTNQYNGCECISAAVLKSSTKVFMKVKVNVPQSRRPQSCPTLSTHEHTVHGILQARILEWVAFPFSRESSKPRD